MKRYLGILLALTMLFAICVPFVAAAESPTFTVSSTQASPGQSVSVSISLANNPGIASIKFLAVYDDSDLTLTRIEYNDAIGGLSQQPQKMSSPVTLIWINGEENSEGDWTFVTLTFEVAANASPGEKRITLTYDPDDIYNIDEVNLGVRVVNGSITVPQTETPKQTETESAPIEVTTPTMFKDVAATEWYAPWVTKAVNMGLFKGNADGTFHPNDPITRAQFVTVLWRMAGKPTPKGAAPFADVRGESEEFRNAIAWAYENGVVNGTSETAFSPRGALTREAAMTILFRLNGAKSGMEMMMTKIYDGSFTDSGAISAWAKPALYWGVYNEIISGTSTKTLSPQGTATRAQIAKILVGYSEKD